MRPERTQKGDLGQGGSKSYRPAQSSPQTQKDQDSGMAAAMGTKKDLVRADGSKVKYLGHEHE